MFVCLIEILFKSPLVLKALANHVDSTQIGRNLLTLFYNQTESELREYVIAQVKRGLQQRGAVNSPVIMWHSLLQMCKIEYINELAFTQKSECERCLLCYTFHVKNHNINVNLFDKTDEVDLAHLLCDYENPDIPIHLRDKFIENSFCKHVFSDNTNWDNLAATMHISFERIRPSESESQHRVVRTKVTLPLVITFDNEAFGLYAIIRMDETGTKHDAIVFDFNNKLHVTERATLIDEHGISQGIDEFNNLAQITSESVVLALYDDIMERHQLLPIPLLEPKSEEQTPEKSPVNTSPQRLSHISKLRNGPVLDEQSIRLMNARPTRYLIHDVVPCQITYKPHSISKHAEGSYFLIIRHFIDENRAHDHIIHDCACLGDDGRCEWIRKTIKPSPARWQTSFNPSDEKRTYLPTVLRTLKGENLICAYVNNVFRVNRFLEPPQPNYVDHYIEHPLIDWRHICSVPEGTTRQ